MQYKKPNCPLCKGEKKSPWFYPIDAKDEQDIFFCCICISCKDVLIVYKWHNEPSDKEVENMIKWAKDNFPYRMPDLNRRTIKDHFHFHMRRGQGHINLKTRKSFFQCPQCGNFFPSETMTICTECKTIQCSNCIKNFGCILCKEESSGEERGEADLEFTQLDDMDTVENEDWEEE